MSVRDIGRAVKEKDPVAGAAAVAGLLPFGRMFKSPITKLLRSGGKKDLQIAHSLDNPADLLNYFDHQPPDVTRVTPHKELSSPSFSIRPHGTDLPFWTHDSPIIIPKPNALEPFNHPAEIFNRDAYVKRGGQMAEALRDPKARLAQRFDPESLRFGENMIGNPGSTGELSHDMVIQASPRFRSFKHYETDPAGASTLMKHNDPSPMDAAMDMEDRMFKWLNDNNFKWKSGDWADRLSNYQGGVKAMREGAARGDPEAKEIMAYVKRAPSEYGELKTKGPLSLTPEKISGILMPTKSSGENVPVEQSDKLIKLLTRRYQDRGVPVHPYDNEFIFNKNQGEGREGWNYLSDMIDQVQQSAPHYGRR